MSMKVFSSAINYAGVTVSDSTLVTCKALYIGTGGDVAISPSSDGSAVVFKNISGGTFLPVELKNGRVMSTNTTALDIISLGW